MGDHDKQPASGDTKSDYIITRIGQVLGVSNKEKFKKSFESEDNKYKKSILINNIYYFFLIMNSNIDPVLMVF